jgi:hypothetical protein
VEVGKRERPLPDADRPAGVSDDLLEHAHGPSGGSPCAAAMSRGSVAHGMGVNRARMTGWIGIANREIETTPGPALPKAAAIARRRCAACASRLCITRTTRRVASAAVQRFPKTGLRPLGIRIRNQTVARARVDKSGHASSLPA